MIKATPISRPSLFAALLLALSLSLSSCSLLDMFDMKKGDLPEEEHANWTAEQFYDAAKQALADKSYDKAAKLYEKLEARYPFGKLAIQAQLEVAYAYYKNGEPDSAIAAADRFIKLNPADPKVDYAIYLKGLVNYNKGLTFIDRFLPTDSSQRDPGSARDSLKDFNELISKYPHSKYVEDSKQRIAALRNNLAMYEIHVADYYLRRGAYVASAKRCNEVIEKYPRTQAIPKALLIMEEAYRKLELNELADDAARVYALNYGEGGKAQAAQQEHELTPAEKVWDFIGFDR